MLAERIDATIEEAGIEIEAVGVIEMVEMAIDLHGEIGTCLMTDVAAVEDVAAETVATAATVMPSEDRTARKAIHLHQRRESLRQILQTLSPFLIDSDA
jgi:hypothetical protein